MAALKEEPLDLVELYERDAKVEPVVMQPEEEEIEIEDKDQPVEAMKHRLYNSVVRNNFFTDSTGKGF